MSELTNQQRFALSEPNDDDRRRAEELWVALQVETSLGGFKVIDAAFVISIAAAAIHSARFNANIAERERILALLREPSEELVEAVALAEFAHEEGARKAVGCGPTDWNELGNRYRYTWLDRAETTMTYTVTPADLRAAREELMQIRAARIAKHQSDVAKLDAELQTDIQGIDADLEAIGVAEQVNEKWSGRFQTNPASVAVDEPAGAAMGDETETDGSVVQASKPVTAAIPRPSTQKGMVLEAVRRIDPGTGAFRWEIEQFIRDQWSVVVPLTSISVYLSRLKDAKQIERNVNVWVPVGGTRTVLSILRQAVEPMTTRDVALEMLVTRALNTDDQRLLALMVKRVGVALRIQRNNGIVRSANGPGQFMLWEIERYRQHEASDRDD